MELPQLQQLYARRHDICLTHARNLLQSQPCRKMLAQIWIGRQTYWNSLQMGNISYLTHDTQLAERLDDEALTSATEWALGYLLNASLPREAFFMELERLENHPPTKLLIEFLLDVLKPMVRQIALKCFLNRHQQHEPLADLRFFTDPSVAQPEILKMKLQDWAEEVVFGGVMTWTGSAVSDVTHKGVSEY